MKKLIKLSLLAILFINVVQAQTIKHNEGITSITKQPQRIVVLDEEMLGWIDALDLSNKVVGIGTSRIQPNDLMNGKIKPERQKVGFLKYGNISNAKFVGTWTILDLETILTLKPDLILRTTWTGNQNYKVAPKII